MKNTKVNAPVMVASVIVVTVGMGSIKIVSLILDKLVSILISTL